MNEKMKQLTVFSAGGEIDSERVNQTPQRREATARPDDRDYEREPPSEPPAGSWWHERGARRAVRPVRMRGVCVEGLTLGEQRWKSARARAHTPGKYAACVDDSTADAENVTLMIRDVCVRTCVSVCVDLTVPFSPNQSLKIHESIQNKFPSPDYTDNKCHEILDSSADLLRRAGRSRNPD